MSQSQIMDCTMAVGQERLLHCALSFFFGASSDVIIPRASFSMGSLNILVLFLDSGVCGESRTDRSFSGLDCRSFGVWKPIRSVALHDSLHTSQVNASGMLGLDVRNFGSRIHVCFFGTYLEGTGMDE